VDADIECRPISAGGVAAEWLAAPGAREDEVVLYFHGGGYVIGSIDTHRALVGRISRASAMTALILGYRLAPEHPFPAALEDATAAYRWLLSTGIRPEKIVLAGDSAGGGLAIATLVALREGGVPLPAAAVCISPWTDLEVSGESMTSRAAIDPMCHKQGISRLAEIYLAGRDPRSPLASPLNADLTGLPPLLVHVGEAETLYDDSSRIVERAKRANVDVTFKEWKEMIHVFPLFVPGIAESRKVIEDIAAFARAHVKQ
jgi:acetyl esterase/lipase